MRHALFLPPFGEFARPQAVMELAVAAEGAGWDGLFLWDHMWRPPEDVEDVADAWITLAGVAAVTRHIRLGTAITPLTRRRPHKVARETVTLDHLSDGRLTLGVGLGVNTGGELERFGEVADQAVMAERLDEALEVILGLWSGEVVNHHGRYFKVDNVRFQPGPVQRPRIPVWGAANGGCGPKPLRRAARLDGLFPVRTTYEQLAGMLAVIAEERGSMEGFDVAMQVAPDADLRELENAGATWAMWPSYGEAVADVVAFARAGPGARGR